MFKKITEPLQFIGTLGIILTGVVLFAPTSTHAELVDCTCFMDIGVGNPDECVHIEQQATETACKTACRKKGQEGGQDNCQQYIFGSGAKDCDLSKEKDCKGPSRTHKTTKM